MHGDARELEAAASVLAGRALLEATCRTLAAEGIVPVALKGVVLSALAEGSGAAPRRMVDVDVLVRERERPTAERLLVAAGLEVVARTSNATTLRDHALGLDLDLHARLVEPELFALDADGVIDRALEDRALFGFLVRVPERKDLYAHLVAHFARGRSNARDRRRVRDFATVADALPMSADTLAAHLVALGLARAARHALGIAAVEDPFARAVLAALPPDPLGDRLARVSGAWLTRFAGASPLAVPALHVLNTTLPAGARSLALHALRGAASRSARMLERARQRR
jgi:hypothetical protein